MKKSLAVALFAFVSCVPVCSQDQSSAAGPDPKSAVKSGTASNPPLQLQPQTQPVPPPTTTTGSTNNPGALDPHAFKSPVYIVKDGAVYLFFGHPLDGFSIPMPGGGASRCIPGSKASRD